MPRRALRFAVDVAACFVIWMLLDNVIGAALGIPDRFSGDPTPLMWTVLFGTAVASVWMVGFASPRLWRRQ